MLFFSCEEHEETTSVWKSKMAFVESDSDSQGHASQMENVIDVQTTFLHFLQN